MRIHVIGLKERMLTAKTIGAAHKSANAFYPFL